MAQLKYNTQTSTSAYEGLPNCTFSAVTTRKPDRLYEITVFRDWTTEGLGLWSVEQENKLMSPMIAAVCYLEAVSRPQHRKGRLKDSLAVLLS